jgi:hypothetical protein
MICATFDSRESVKPASFRCRIGLSVNDPGVLQQAGGLPPFSFFLFFFLLSFFPFIKPTGAVAGISNETWRFGSVWLMGIILERALKLVNRDHGPVVEKLRH